MKARRRGFGIIMGSCVFNIFEGLKDSGYALSSTRQKGLCTPPFFLFLTGSGARNCLMSTGHVSYTSRMIKATWVPCEKRERSRIKGSYRTSTVPALKGERRGSLPLFNYERIHNVESESFSRRIWSLMVIAISSCIPVTTAVCMKSCTITEFSDSHF